MQPEESWKKMPVPCLKLYIKYIICGCSYIVTYVFILVSVNKSLQIYIIVFFIHFKKSCNVKYQKTERHLNNCRLVYVMHILVVWD